jgi:hypothetical protein
MGCTNLELLLDATISLTSGSRSGSGSGAPKSSSYGSAKSVKSKQKKILFFQTGDDTAGVGRRRVYREKARLRARGTWGMWPVLPGGGGGREERGWVVTGEPGWGRRQGKMVNSHSFYFCWPTLKRQRGWREYFFRLVLSFGFFFTLRCSIYIVLSSYIVVCCSHVST